MNSQLFAYIKRITTTFQTATCTIQQRTGLTNAMGDPGETFDTVASGVPCRVITEGGYGQNRSQPVASREAQVDAYRISLPAGTVIGHDYRVIVVDDTYDVTGIIDQRTDENDIQVRVVKVRGE